MTDYGALADKLKGLEEAVKPAHERLARHGIDPVAFYESVKAQINEEVEKANVELHKRRLPTIERIFVPSLYGKLCLTFGVGLLCHVDLQEAKGRITVMISGPPHGLEIARKEYLLSRETTGLQAFPDDAAQNVAAGYGPDRLAAEIVSELLGEGISLAQKRSQNFASSGKGSPAARDPRTFAEFWISLTSVLSRYTDAYGLSANRHATVDVDEDRITVRRGEK